MKKVSLQDMKNKNRSFILQCILEQDGLSRTELAMQSGLSNSTVSSLVSELLQEQVLTETGESASTGGRKRIGLTINPGYASIAIVNVKRNGASLFLFDMQLRKIDEQVLASTYISGNDLLISITSAIFDLTCKHSLSARKLAGIGLLFQEDMLESEFNVMYSTSLSSASISLKDALFTQFHSLVVQEYSQSYAMAQSAAELEENRNIAFIHIGQKVLTRITMEGKAMCLHGNKVLDITPLAESRETKWPMLTEEANEGAKTKKRTSGLMNQAAVAKERSLLAVHLLAKAVKPLCVLFSLNEVVLSGRFLRQADFISAFRSSLAKQMEPLPIPDIKSAQAEAGPDASDFLADKIRKTVLCGI